MSPSLQEGERCPDDLRITLRALEPRPALASTFWLAGRRGDGLDDVIAPPPPVSGAPATEVVAYFTSHHLSLEIESVNLSVGMIFLLIFAASLHTLIGSTVSLTAFVAATVMAAYTLIEVAAFEALVRLLPLLRGLQMLAWKVSQSAEAPCW